MMRTKSRARAGVTSGEVARHANVSIATVSRVLNQSVSVADETSARVLAAVATAEAPLERLAELAPVALIKRGAAGALGCAGDVRASAPAIAVEPHDTTGAGDCFNAGFLYGYLRNLPLETCLRCGNICGGLATTAHRSSALPTITQLEA